MSHEIAQLNNQLINEVLDSIAQVGLAVKSKGDPFLLQHTYNKSIEALANAMFITTYNSGLDLLEVSEILGDFSIAIADLAHIFNKPVELMEVEVMDRFTMIDPEDVETSQRLAAQGKLH